tara:strand:+ start:225 stop:581 length:357 start_codon:yes stop_codon:yes gene_type:complete
MPYALIPEGFTLKKVTKAQQDAIDEYFGRERRGSYLNTLIENPATTTLVGGALTGGALLALINKFFSEGGPFTKEEIVEKLNPLAILETAIETTSPTMNITASLETLTSALLEREQNK